MTLCVWGQTASQVKVRGSSKQRGVPSVHDLKSRRDDSTSDSMGAFLRSPRGLSEGLGSPPATARDDFRNMGTSIVSGYKAMYSNVSLVARGGHRKPVVENPTNPGPEDQRASNDKPQLAPLTPNTERHMAMREAVALSRDNSEKSLASLALKDTVRLTDEMDRKLKDLEELIRKTKAMCLESLSEQAFKDIYDFFQTNVTSKDNMLNDQQLGELERIVMNACGNNIQKSYVVLFNVQVCTLRPSPVRQYYLSLSYELLFPYRFSVAHIRCVCLFFVSLVTEIISSRR